MTRFRSQLLITLVLVMSHRPAAAQSDATIETFLADYPLQRTNDFMHERLGADHTGLNTWFLESGRLAKAGEEQECAEQDQNCLPTPAGAFDIAGRFYRPSASLLREEWQLAQPVLER